MKPDPNRCEGCGAKRKKNNFVNEATGLCKVCHRNMLKYDKEHPAPAAGDLDEDGQPTHAASVTLKEYLKDKMDAKTGPFTDWSEDAEEVEIRLELPRETTRAELNVTVGTTAVLVTRAKEGEATPTTLLKASPLSGSCVSCDTAWYLEDGRLKMTLIKQEAGVTWGKRLAESDGVFYCWTQLRDAMNLETAVAAGSEQEQDEEEREILQGMQETIDKHRDEDGKVGSRNNDARRVCHAH